MSEAQKYQGHLYRGEKKGKGPQQQRQPPAAHDQALVPHKNRFEEDAGAVAIVNVPPKAPSPPPASDGLPPGVNLMDFLVKDAPAPANGNTKSYVENGFAYGNGPVEPSAERYDSYTALPGPKDVLKPSAPTTPYLKRDREEKKSEKKRKRDNLELDTSCTRQGRDGEMADADTPGMHTGLTGGLNRMLSGPNFSGDEAPTPLNPGKKRNKKETSDKHEKRKVSGATAKTSSTRRSREGEEDRGRDSTREDPHRSRKHRRHRQADPYSSGEEDAHGGKQIKAIEPRNASVQPHADNQMVAYHSPAELFLSYVNKGPESERGLSINKALKRYHRDQDSRGERDDGDKELWKQLRVRRNDRGEFVLFVGQD